MSAGTGAGRISVVIPTKDRVELLRHTLRSVVEQTRPPDSLIVVDDGSTDATAKVVAEYGGIHLEHPGGGLGAANARNVGLRAATSEFVSFLDSDDLHRPRALELLHAALQSDGTAPFAFGQALAAHRLDGTWLPDGLVAPDASELRDLLTSLYVRNMIPSGGCLVRREMALELGGWDPRSFYFEDHDFWVKLARRARPAYVPEVVCIYRRHVGNRMAPRKARADYALITTVADEDPRLDAARGRRAGVELLELSVDSVHSRSAVDLGLAVATWLRRPSRVAAARSAVTHQQRRRRAKQDAIRLLASDAELRDWLSSYG